jgi:hypothetical protein
VQQPDFMAYPLYIHTYIHTYIRTCIHTYIHTCIHTYIHTYVHTQTRDEQRHFIINLSMFQLARSVRKQCYSTLISTWPVFQTNYSSAKQSLRYIYGACDLCSFPYKRLVYVHKLDGLQGHKFPAAGVVNFESNKMTT